MGLPAIAKVYFTNQAHVWKALACKEYPDDHLAMHYAVKKGLVYVKRLLGEGYPVNNRDFRGYTPLFITPQNKEVIETLLDSEADVNAKGGGYGNALQATACSGEIEIVQLLLKRGADVNAQGGHQLLLERGADVNAHGGPFGNVLQAAAQNGNIAVVQLLLERGADVNAQGDEYETALQAAAYSGKIEICTAAVREGSGCQCAGGLFWNCASSCCIRQQD